MPLPNALMTDKQYLRAGGGVCPSCRESDVEGDSIDVDGKTAGQDVSCNSCGATWRDQYKLVGYEILTTPDDEDEPGKDEPDQ